MAASKPADRHTHTRVQCSPASVRLAQARPNYFGPKCVHIREVPLYIYWTVLLDPWYLCHLSD